MSELTPIQSLSKLPMSDYIRDFRMHRSSKETESVSKGRVKSGSLNFTFPVSFSNHFQYKSRVYNLPGFNFYPISINFLDERLKKDIKIDLELMTVYDLYAKLKELGNNQVIDVYFDSIKENSKNMLCIFDYDNIVFITKKSTMSMRLVRRNIVKDYSSIEGNTIVIPFDDKSLFNDSFKLVFANGFKTNNYSIEVNKDGSTSISVGDNETTQCEVVLLPGFVRQLLIQDTNWKDIYEGAKLTINMDDILVFVSGKLSSISSLDYERKGNSIIRMLSYNKFGREIVILHDEKSPDKEIIQTYNVYDWYRDKINPNVISELNAGNAPEVINKFKNFYEDISSNNSFTCNMSEYDFNKGNIIKIINYNSDNFKVYIDDYLSKRTNFSYNMYMNANAYGYNKYVKYDNSDVPTKYTEKFSFPMVLIKISNPEYKPLKVYIDGIALYRHLKIYNAMGESYIYIRLNKFIKNSVVEIERYNTESKRYDESVMINEDGIFNLPKPYKKDLLSIYKVTGDSYTPSTFNYDENTGSITITGDSVRGMYRIIANNAIVTNEFVVNSRKLELIQFDMPNHKYSIYDSNYYRVYKNGRLIPRKFYNIEFPTSENKRTVPFITVNCKCYLSEVIDVEFCPVKMKEVYSQDIIDEFGRIKIDKTSLEYPIGLNIDSIYLNGRKLNNENIIQKSATGMELINIISRKNFYILLKEDYDTTTNFPEFTETFKSGNSDFDNYIKSVMVGSRINDLETDELDKDYNVMRDLYWDLYNEYLKYAIVNFGDKIPKYIAIKYSDLVDEEDMVLIDCSEQMNHWMPLDASNTIDQKMDHILQIYEQMVDRITNMENIEPYELSDYEIEKLKAAGLITDNVIGIDLSI